MLEIKYNKYIPINLYDGHNSSELDLKAICFFISTGFFLEDDTYWKDRKWAQLNFESQPWESKPREINLSRAVEEFADLFHLIVKEQTKEGKPILALSGGLDSRTLAVALKNIGIEPFTFSYKLEGSFNETVYGKEIANEFGWEFKDYEIPRGYLWNKLKNAALINKCYAEFTHPRQFAILEDLEYRGDFFLLGHWGDVLFDGVAIQPDATEQQKVDYLFDTIVKKAGIETAQKLWDEWKLDGDFKLDLKERFRQMLARIDIQNSKAQIRAFKSLYWATRWTSTNLSYFDHYKPLALPYYDDRMCDFIMTLPEEILDGRQIQIEYIKKYSPELANIVWQEKKPYNLYTYKNHLTLNHLPYRITNKAKRVFMQWSSGRNMTIRNWEIQFLGCENDNELRKWLFDNKNLHNLVPRNIIEETYSEFLNGDSIQWSHAISMLLTLSVFTKMVSINN